MNENFDIKEIERKAYFNYHKDGIVDIFLGIDSNFYDILLWPVHNIYDSFTTNILPRRKKKIHLPKARIR